jgi:kynurenine formamidase
LADVFDSPDISRFISKLTSARLIDLEQPRRQGDPVHPNHVPGMQVMLHRRHEPAREARTSAAAMVFMAEHAGTHIDAFCHQADALQLYGGIPVSPAVQTPTGFTQLGAETIAPIFRRGVLLDLVKVRGQRLEPNELVEPSDLEGAEASGGVTVGEGDVLLVRTGYATLWADPPAYLTAAGMSAASSQWAVDRGVFAVGADNMSWDVVSHVDPVLGTLPGHLILLARSGVHIIENLNLEELASAGATEFVFACFPLKVVGGTGAAVRPVAILPA